MPPDAGAPPTPGSTTDPTLIDPAGGGPDVPLTLPETIDHYRVVRLIGQGGMGSVVKCLDTTLGRYVALKILRPRLARDEAFIARFRKEAHAVAKLRHPNIVQIHAIGASGDLHYFTMEYVDGEGLDRVLARRTRLPEAEVLRIGAQVARALEAAHRAEVLHRDVKPGNVLVDTSGRALLSDFGLAKFAFHHVVRLASTTPDGAPRGDPAQTDPGRIMGTPYYMAPEVIQGKDADPRADCYALGVMCYELLTGDVPFRADHVAAIFEAHVHRLPRPIAETVPEVSLETANIVYRAMEKEPARRFPDAGAMAAAFEGALDRERREADRRERAKLGAEMATAFAGLRTAERRGPGLARLVSLGVLLALAVGTMILLLGALELPSAPAATGTSDADARWAVGTTVRAGGRVDAIEVGDDLVRLRLVGPDTPRWVRMARTWWDAWSGAPPTEGAFWTAEGRVEPVANAAAELRAAEGRLLPARAWEWLEVYEDSADPRGVKPRLYRGDPAALPPRRGLQATVLARLAGPAPGDVRLLVGDAETRAWVLLPVAVARRLAPRDVRVGDDIQAVGMWSAREVEEPPPFDPPGTLRVDKAGELILAPGGR